MKLFIKVLATLFALTTVIACNSTTKDSSLPDSPLRDTSLTNTSSEDNTIHKRAAADTTNFAKNSEALGPEQSFINYMVPKNNNEIIWLKAALTRSLFKELKQQSLIMLKEHDQLAEDIKGYIAKHPTISRPKVDASNTVTINNKTGADWDKAWADKMVDDYNEMLDKLQSAKSYIGDSALNKLIINTIPLVASHLSRAKTLQAKLKIN